MLAGFLLLATLIPACNPQSSGPGGSLGGGGTTPVRPNVVLIVADDLGYKDLGVHGSADALTPHIDSIAAGGVRCTNGYVSGPYCSPTRAGLLTGRYQQRFGHEFNPGLGSRHGLPLTEVTIADRLKAAGYATGLVGKWHLGEPAAYHPMLRGFDEFYGFLEGARAYYGGSVKRGTANEPLRDTSPRGSALRRRTSSTAAGRIRSSSSSPSMRSTRRWTPRRRSTWTGSPA